MSEDSEEAHECPTCGASTFSQTDHSCERVLRLRREDEQMVTADK